MDIVRQAAYVSLHNISDSLYSEIYPPLLCPHVPPSLTVRWMIDLSNLHAFLKLSIDEIKKTGRHAERIVQIEMHI